MNWIDVISGTISGGILVGLYFYLMEFRFSKKVTVWVISIYFLMSLGGYIFGLLVLDAPASTVSMVTMTIPSFLLCMIMVKYGLNQGLFFFCANDIMGFVATLSAKLLQMVLGQGTGFYLLYTVLFLLPWIGIVIKVREPMRQLMREVHKGWGWLTCEVLLFYVMINFLLIYPSAMRERLEYIPVIVAFGFLILATFGLIGAAVKKMYQVWRMEAEEEILKVAIQEKEERLKRKQLLLMVSQIKPHFINNTLNSINVLMDSDVEGARRMLQDFAVYLRNNLEGAEDMELIPFSRELQHIRAYADIEKRRFPRVKVEYRLETENFCIVPLSLQPLMENAIRHGAAPKYGGGTVRMNTVREDDFVRITIEDDGVGFETDQDNDRSVGIRNVKYRLAELMQAQVKVDSKIGKGTRIEIRVPFIEAAMDEDNIGG